MASLKKGHSSDLEIIISDRAENLKSTNTTATLAQAYDVILILRNVL